MFRNSEQKGDMFYSYIGIPASVSVAIAVWWCLKSGLSRETPPGKEIQKAYSQAFLGCVPRAYESAGTLRGMLTLLVEQCPKENGRAKAALDYLEHSRYRDYETALAYLSDSSAVCEKQIREVLKREIQKTTALTCH